MAHVVPAVGHFPNDTHVNSGVKAMTPPTHTLPLRNKLLLKNEPATAATRIWEKRVYNTSQCTVPSLQGHSAVCYMCPVSPGPPPPHWCSWSHGVAGSAGISLPFLSGLLGATSGGPSSHPATWPGASTGETEAQSIPNKQQAKLTGQEVDGK